MPSFFTSEEKRVENTIEFMKSKNCAPELVARVEAEILKGTTKKDAGEYIKLGFGIDSEQRRAVRSILLCRYLFVDCNAKMNAFGKASFGDKKSMKDHWLNLPSAATLTGVAAYAIVPRGERSLADLLEALPKPPGTAVFKYYEMNRSNFTNLGSKGAICYQSIALALWLGGYTSIGWLANWYASLQAKNCFEVLGEGTEVLDYRKALNLTGTVISFRGRQPGYSSKIGSGEQVSQPWVNHWAILTGDGSAIASNTDGFREKGKPDAGGDYDFEWGGRNFGKFKVSDCMAACTGSTKYKDAGGVRFATHRIVDMDLW